MPPSTDLLQGTLDVLILKTLALEPMHGWGVAQRIQQISKNVLQIGRVRSIRGCIGWNTRDGSSRTGEAPIIIAARNIIH